MTIHRSYHSAFLTRTKRLIEQSKDLLCQSSASTFLGIKHHDPFPLARRSVRVPLLRLIEGGYSRGNAPPVTMEWQTTRSAPFCCDLQLAVIDTGGIHALAFPCRRVLHGWLKAETNASVLVSPTHWREWKDGYSALFSVVSAPEQVGEF